MSTLKVNKLRDTAGSADAITLDPNGGAVLAGVTTMTTARVTSGIVTNTFIVGAGVTIVGLEFNCPSGPGIVTYPSGNKGYVFETVTVAPGRYVDAHNLIQLNRREIQDKSLAQIAVEFPDFYFEGDSQTNTRSRYAINYHNRIIIL